MAAACAGDEAGDDEATGTETEESSTTEDTTADDDGSMDEDDGSMDEEDGEMEEVDLSGTTVTITGPERTEQDIGALNAAFAPFTERTGVTVTYAGSADWEAEINVAVEAGTEPDISIFPQPGKMADFARDGFLLPLPDDVNATMESNWDAAWTVFGNVDGQQIGIPVKNDLKSLVWYQPARFESLGYDVPQSWDELKTLTETAIADGNTPWCVGIESAQATGWPFTDWVEDLMLRFHGVDVYDQWVAGDVDFADERVVQIFDEIRNLWTDDAVFAQGGSIAATNFGDNGEPLVDGDCLMHRQANFFAGFFPEGTAFADGSEAAVDVFYFPSVDGSRPLLGAGTLVGAFHDRPEVWAVMEYMSTPEYAETRQVAQTELLDGGLSGFLSAVKGQDMSVYQPLEQSFIDILANAEVIRFDGSDLMPADVGAGTFWSAGTSFVNGDIDAATAAAEIDASWP
jgi:alpha-glucoside transport system substrate-binding protein